MVHPILGLHHVTATVGDAQSDVDLCTGALGLRLVKKTVNFDNRGVYHFYYGDERGTRGTIWTTFPYRGKGVRVGRHGAGQVIRTSFSVPARSLEFWRARLSEREIPVSEGVSPFGEKALEFADASGLSFELVAADRDDRKPWAHGGVDSGAEIRGIHRVTLEVQDPSGTVALMSDMLGFRVEHETAGAIRMAAENDAPGHFVD